MSKRLEFTVKTQTDAFERSGRRCESCGIALRDGMRKEFDHIKPAFYKGTNHLDNCQVLCGHCHDEKTHDMNSNKAVISMPKSRRMIKKSAGLRGRKRKGPPMPGTKASGWKKCMTTGEWVRR